MEHELRKHIKNIVTETVNREKSIWKRVADIALECLIIVFAVSFAVFMERQREHKHEQQEANEFLQGLKLDLENDIAEMKNDRAAYVSMETSYSYFSKKEKPNLDSNKKYVQYIGDVIELLPNIGRYEGFKSSGKMNTVENSDLRNKIHDLYEEVLPGLLNSTTYFNNRRRETEKLFIESDFDINKVTQNKYFKSYASIYKWECSAILRRYTKAIDEAEKILQLIEKEN